MRLRYAFTKFEPRDIWVGVFWDRLPDGWIAIYVCPIPMLVVRVDVAHK